MLRLFSQPPGDPEAGSGSIARLLKILEPAPALPIVQLKKWFLPHCLVDLIIWFTYILDVEGEISVYDYVL